MRNTIFLMTTSLLVFASCKKHIASDNEERAISYSNSYRKDKILTTLFSIGENVGVLSKQQNFRNIVYSEVAKQFDGDDNALLETILNNLDSQNKNANISVPIKDALLSSIYSLKTDFKSKHYPQIYIPFFEEKEAKKRKNDSPIIFVIWDGKETERDSYPGYIINGNGKFEKLGYLITEDFASKNEVWVISNNETINFSDIQPDSSSERTSGYQEKVYQIRVPNLGAIEGWPAGKIELKLSAGSSSTKFFEGELPAIKRKHLKNQRWHTLDRFLFRWYPDLNGKIIGLAWIEVDDGGDDDETLSYTIPANNGFPTITYTVKFSDNDENCGYQVVQYDDPISQVYGTGKIDWKMRNTP